ncbi:hypothetical protein KP509_04G083900 [Ceratopteris richardii]|uniref:Bifunctional inhibitor/plant lipid transfer protein/seed storage helical domain-containing protein n=1 Tax=Ceratopteris richardii TaxID=49495 RepID=A0A8T2UYU0_CERRI|nr:hypothetical protein KP509_04G083900 [Ceratopteris richardii]
MQNLNAAAMVLLFAVLLTSWSATSARELLDSEAVACEKAAVSQEALMAACQAYVVGMAPLPMWGAGASACCSALRDSPLSCLCSQTLPSYVLQFVNVKAVKNVLQTCGLELPSENTCGGLKLGD